VYKQFVCKNFEFEFVDKHSALTQLKKKQQQPKLWLVQTKVSRQVEQRVVLQVVEQNCVAICAVVVVDVRFCV